MAYNRGMDERTASAGPTRDPARIMLVTAAAGYVHQSIPTVWRALPEIAREAGTETGRLEVATILRDVADLGGLSAATLAEHDVLCFVHTSGTLPFSEAQRQAILDFVAAGHGFVGVHGATTICYEWVEYGAMLGVQFKSHPPAATFIVTVEDHEHPSTRALPSAFEVRDELYTFRTSPRETAHILLSAAPGSLDLGRDLPLAWTKPHGDGRVYYNALGHFDEMWDDLAFRAQIGAGLRWAARLEP